MQPPTADTAPTPGRRERDLACPWWIIAILAIAFAVLAVIARGPNTLGIDLDVSGWVQDRDSPLASQMASFGNFLGDKVFSLSLLAIAWVGLTVLRLRRDLWFVAIVAVERLLATLLKGLLDSPRPTIEQVSLTGSFDGTGFPSGHAMTSAITLGSIAILVDRHVHRSDVRAWLLALWLAGVFLTAWARIWYGAHWFTDTLGGILAGAAFVLLAANLSELIAAPDPVPAESDT
jgi:membrane-associated phospholipid phosphatase